MGQITLTRPVSSRFAGVAGGPHDRADRESRSCPGAERAGEPMEPMERRACMCDASATPLHSLHSLHCLHLRLRLLMQALKKRKRGCSDARRTTHMGPGDGAVLLGAEDLPALHGANDRPTLGGGHCLFLSFFSQQAQRNGKFRKFQSSDCSFPPFLDPAKRMDSDDQARPSLVWSHPVCCDMLWFSRGVAKPGVLAFAPPPRLRHPPSHPRPEVTVRGARVLKQPRAPSHECVDG